MKREAKTFNSEIEYTLDFRKVKYPRLEFKTGQLHLVLPLDYKSETEVLKNNKKWIKQKQKTISKAIKDSKNKRLENRSKKELEKLIKKYYNQSSESQEINKFYFRKMKSKWASLSSNKNLTFNTKMRFLPEKLIRYILIHELTHIRERKHNKKFWEIVEKSIRDYKKKEKELFEYWFLINSKI